MSEYPYFSPARLRAALDEHGGAPRKRLGQNFLVDPNHVRRIGEEVLKAAADGADDAPLLEIGPGPGALTHYLLGAGRRVLAAEIDPVLADLLEGLVGRRPEFRILRGDARELLSAGPESQLAREPFEGVSPRVIYGNLPYYITTDLLLGALAWSGLQAAVFLVQHEFALRLVGGSESSLAVYAGNLCDVRIVHTVPASAFYPAPDVRSSLIALSPHAAGPRCHPPRLERLLRATYQGKRKTIRNNWKGNAAREGLAAEALFAAAGEVGLDVSARPEAIESSLYYALVRELNRFEDHHGDGAQHQEDL